MRGYFILWSVIVDVYNWFTALMLSFRATDVLDIVAISFIIYNIIKIARETRAEQLLKGILILLVGFTISQIFNLKMLNALFTSFFQFSMLAVLIDIAAAGLTGMLLDRACGDADCTHCHCSSCCAQNDFLHCCFHFIFLHIHSLSDLFRCCY